MKRPPLKDVAALAEVSEPTVSRVLNGKAGVATATRNRVIAALSQLGFDAVPDPNRTRDGVVGLICGEFTNPVFPTFVHQISTALAQRGHLTSVAVTDRHLNPEQRCIDEFLDTGVGSIIFIGGHHAEMDGDLDVYRALVDQGRGIVLVNGRATDLDVPHVRSDEEAGSVKATSHLLQLGHTRVGLLLGASRYVPTRRFIAGYQRALQRFDLEEPAGALVETVFTLEGGRAGAARLLNRGITGIVAGNDLMALGAIQAAAGAGLRVPHEVSVVGYDGTEFTSVTSPPLTTLRQPFEDMAQLICDAAIDELNGGRRFRDHYVFNPELLARGSSGILHQSGPAATSAAS